MGWAPGKQAKGRGKAPPKAPGKPRPNGALQLAYMQATPHRKYKWQLEQL